MEGKGELLTVFFFFLVCVSNSVCRPSLCLLYKPELPLSGYEIHKEAGECKCSQDNGDVMVSAQHFTAC